MAYLSQAPKSSLTAKNPFVKPPASTGISRPVVQGPDPGLYAPPPKLPDVVLPNRSDFGGGAGGMAGVAGSDPVDLAQARKDAAGFREGYNDPTHSSSFASLMGLASEQTGQATSEAARTAQDATSRAGYAGGFNQAAKQAEVNRMHSLSETGFAGAAQVRKESLAGYGIAQGSVTELSKSANMAMTEMNVAFGNALARAHSDQAAQNLGFADLVSKYQLGYADAKSAAQRLQGELDAKYNDQLIDDAKYKQMSASLENEWNLTQQKIAEQTRQFNVTAGQAATHEYNTNEMGMKSLAEQKSEAGNKANLANMNSPVNPFVRGTPEYQQWVDAHRV